MRLKYLLLPLITAFLFGCSPQDPQRSNSLGQVQPVSTGAKVSYYAAARFAEQAAFGPTPELIAEIQSKGFEKWIDDQFVLPATQIDYSSKQQLLHDWDMGESEKAVWGWYRAQFPHMTVGAPDQLRLRVTWSLSQYIAVSDRRLKPIAVLDWMNLLQRISLSDYASILDQITRSASMGWYLDNNQNRPKSEQCPWCAPNENYARELMQLFSIGIVELNSDGSVKKDSNGRPIETYNQRDVEQLAMALTGWENVQRKNFVRTKRSENETDFSQPMVPANWEAFHAWGEKRVMGTVIPAGQNAEKDLQSVVRMLMAHNNIAPFVSLRLIQNLVKSNPSPEYVQRVSAVFLNNGKGVKGDMRAIVKAILLDPEARRGDDVRALRTGDGKIREPYQYLIATLRGLSCKQLPTDMTGNANLNSSQQPFNAETVFSFYAPTDTASGTDILAPEQRLLNAEEFNTRLNQLRWLNWTPVLREGEEAARLSLTAAGCDVNGLITANKLSADAFFDYISPRFFRGAMPQTLKLEMARVRTELVAKTYITDLEAASTLLQYALMSPYYGAQR